MDWSAERQKILAHNIANADTPGYKRMDLDFPGALKKSIEKLELKRTHPAHLSGTETKKSLLQNDWGSVRVDQNNVDAEVEMIRYSENALYFQGLTQELNNQFRRLRMAIGGRS
jgi:flagellar basal-body rod protein FlgB